MADRKKSTKRPAAKFSRPPHATQTISMALYVEDLEMLDTALERHNAEGGRASRSYAIRWLINYADEQGLWDELPKRF
jgi:hypothetical protein